MRLLQFHAATMTAAMAQVRRALGDDALILSSRRAGGGVELTAAVEANEPEASPQSWRATGGGLAPSSDRSASLAWHGVPDRLAGRLGAGPLAFAISAALRFAALPLGQGATPLLFVGPPGVGKTLTVARLATRLVLAGVRPLVVTTDATRAGADEQLAALLRLLGIALQHGHEPDTVRDAIRLRRDGAPVLIDSAGLDPFSPAALAWAKSLAEAAGAEPVAVLAAGIDAGEAADIAAALAGVGASKLVCTRLDLARRMGGVLAAAATLSLAELGLGPGAADGLLPASPALLARCLDATRPPPSPRPPPRPAPTPAPPPPPRAGGPRR